jgi:1-aminocyclopropane-1-carboxylate deaminase/D-cysteine desulfhydrase-like pyridoxal-dependent ACC family enzyme
MRPLSFESITVDEIDLPLLHEKKVRCSVLRIDKIHPVISGNKWFKLKYYLEEAKALGKKCIATFGGAYSNHIIATAAAGELFNLRSVGIIRGERPSTLSFTLKQAMDHGMNLFFVTREQYTQKILPPEISDKEQIYLINEGGYGPKGTKGAAEILNHCERDNYSHIACAVGTSTMMAGLIMGSLSSQETIGIPVLRNKIDLESALLGSLSPATKTKKFQMIHDYHFGGYAKCNAQLIRFMNDMYKNIGIPTDFVYTGKLFFGIFDLIRNNFFPEGSRLLIVHSGGLQGNGSLPRGALIF